MYEVSLHLQPVLWANQWECDIFLQSLALVLLRLGISVLFIRTWRRCHFSLHSVVLPCFPALRPWSCFPALGAGAICIRAQRYCHLFPRLAPLSTDVMFSHA